MLTAAQRVDRHYREVRARRLAGANLSTYTPKDGRFTRTTLFLVLWVTYEEAQPHSFLRS